MATWNNQRVIIISNHFCGSTPYKLPGSWSHKKLPRLFFASRSMTSKPAPTAGARSTLLMINRSDCVIPQHHDTLEKWWFRQLYIYIYIWWFIRWHTWYMIAKLVGFSSYSSWSTWETGSCMICGSPNMVSNPVDIDPQPFQETGDS